MPAFKKNGPGCCTCTTTPPPCPVTIHVVDRGTGMPIAGVPITLSGSVLPTPSSGTTDSSGNWTLPSVSPSHPVTATVSYDGLTLAVPNLSDNMANCTTSVNVCYCHASVAVNYTSGATLTSYALGLSSNPMTRTDSGSTSTFSYHDLKLCTVASALPITLILSTSGPAGYLPECANVPVTCGTASTIDLTSYYYDTCYLLSPCCPDVCEPGVKGPSGRGLTPKNIQVRPYTIRTGAGDRIGNNLGGTGTAGGAIFAGDDGGWVTMPAGSIVSGMPTWDSGCRPAQGNYVSCPSGTLNGPFTGATAYPYTGTRIVVTDCVASSGSTYYQVQYFRYGDSCPGGSTGVATVGGVFCPASGHFNGTQTSAQGPINHCLTTPVDATVTGSAGGSAWGFEIREVACAAVPIDPGPPTGGG